MLRKVLPESFVGRCKWYYRGSLSKYGPEAVNSLEMRHGSQLLPHAMTLSCEVQKFVVAPLRILGTEVGENPFVSYARPRRTRSGN
jgi:hypothetical protein